VDSFQGIGLIQAEKDLFMDSGGVGGEVLADRGACQGVEGVVDIWVLLRLVLKTPSVPVLAGEDGVGL
jgi:hypothetical protein